MCCGRGTKEKYKVLKNVHQTDNSLLAVPKIILTKNRPQLDQGRALGYHAGGLWFEL